MPVADLAQAFPITRRRDDGAAGILHGLGDEHRDRLWPLELDRRLDLFEEGLRESRLIAAGRVAVGVRRRDVRGRHGERLESRAADRDAGERQGAQRDAVVCVAAGDRLAPRRLAVRLVVLHRHLVGRLDRLGSARGEERALEAGGGQLSQLRGQLDRGGMSDRPVRGEGKRRHLRRRLRPQLLAVGVAQVEAIKTGQPVDVAVPVVVVDVGALASHDDGDVLGRDRHVREMEHEVLLCKVLEARHEREVYASSTLRSIAAPAEIAA